MKDESDKEFLALSTLISKSLCICECMYVSMYLSVKEKPVVVLSPSSILDIIMRYEYRIE